MFNFRKKPKKLLKATPIRRKPLILLCDQKKGLCTAWKKEFENRPGVEIYHGDIFKLKADAIVSPANSFGDMDGGIDKAIDNYYDRLAQKEAESRIEWEFYGELPVGSATVINMPQKRISHLVIAPTMRIPGILSKKSLNPYLAMRAALVAAIRFNKKSEAGISALAVPGLATGVGGMPYGVVARQMRYAFDQIIMGEWKKVKHPAMAPFASRK